MPDPLRVLHCPTVVGGNAQQLARSERVLGLRSWAVSFRQSPYGYTCDEILWRSTWPAVFCECCRWSLLWRALRHFDVVHFNFGMPILPKPGPFNASHGSSLRSKAYRAYCQSVAFKDLALLRRLKKAIFVTYQGDDARQGDYCRDNFEISHVHEVGPEYYPPGSDEEKRRDIACFATYADGIYALNPDLLHVLPPQARFLPYSHVDLQEWKPGPRLSMSRPYPLVVHAPSHKGAKGTRHVLGAVEKLRAEGVEFEFRLVEQLSNVDARRIYEQADVVVDQLLVGWYGGFAVECMALGKPVICYIRDQDLERIPTNMRAELPILRADPVTIYHVLKDCLTARRNQLPKIGELSRMYVERWHDPLQIAASLKNDYENAIAAKKR